MNMIWVQKKLLLQNATQTTLALWKGKAPQQVWGYNTAGFQTTLKLQQDKLSSMFWMGTFLSIIKHSDLWGDNWKKEMHKWKH